MAIHGVNYDRDFEGLGALPCGDSGAIGSWLVGSFTGGFTGGSLCGLGSLGTGSPGPILAKILLQPLGWEAHGRY